MCIDGFVLMDQEAARSTSVFCCVLLNRYWKIETVLGTRGYLKSEPRSTQSLFRIADVSPRSVPPGLQRTPVRVRPKTENSNPYGFEIIDP